MNASAQLTRAESRATLSLALVFALRMFGMFAILPVLALHARNLPGGDSHLLIGLALGIDGLAQALLQIPSGLLSDRWGRKPVIYGGLLLFALGSFVAGSGDSLAVIILGRLLQGTGAISSSVIALTADLTSETNRSKAMALIGMSIGLSFGLSMIAGPALEHLIGVPGIFMLTGILACAALLVVRFVVPTPLASERHADAETVPGQIMSVLRHRELQRLDFGIFALHAAMRGLFVALPFLLVDSVGLAGAQHWKVYLPVLLLSFLGAVPAIVIAEKHGRMKAVFCGAIGLLLAALLLLAIFSASRYGVLGTTFLFFLAFNLLEASLPSLVSKIAPPGSKGTALGVYNCAQFFGLFLGGLLGGYCAQQWGLGSVFLATAALVLLWFVFALPMRVPTENRR